MITAMTITQLVLLGLLLIAAGLGAGFAGGLFGIGGGIIVVPVLYFVFGLMDIDDSVRMTLAIGTSLSVIIVTAARSLIAHHASGQVDMPLLRGWLGWIGVGAFAAGFIARLVPTHLLTLIFAAGALYVGLSRLRGGKSRVPRTRDETIIDGPHWADRFAPILGVLTGFFSSLLGLGGGAAGVLIMGWTGRAIHKAVATASGFGLGVAIPGVIGFIVAGWNNPLLPTGSMGFVFVPAFAMLAMMTALTAPIGARAAHRLAPQRLSMLFGGYVLVMAMLMIREGLRGF